METGFSLISKYIDWVDANRDGDILYRGHGMTTWTLTPSAYRMGSAGISSLASLHNWSLAASKAIKKTPASKLEWLVLAQHFGIPTPLLDWTTNPLTALFFACAENYGEHDSCVILANRTEFDSVLMDDEIDPFSMHIVRPKLINSELMNDRTLAQDSVMSVHGNMFTTMPEVDRVTFSIPYTRRGWVKHDLERLGFTPARIYGDIHGVAQAYHSSLIEYRNKQRLWESGNKTV